MKLPEILEDYIKMVNYYEEIPLSPSGKVVEGGIYQLPGSQPLFVAAVNREGDFVEVAPLSFCWPLATRLDLIVEFHHPFSDTWIVQTDLAVSVPERLLREAELVGELKEEDLKVLKRTLKGEAPLPKERRGRGYGDPVHERFKDFEYERYKFLIEELLSCVEKEEEEKERHVEFFVPKFLKKLLSETAALAPAADSKESVLELKDATLIFTDEGVEALIAKELVGKEGRVKVETKEGEATLYEGKLPELITFKNLDFNAFKALSALKIETKEGQGGKN